jgi:biotin transport system permease protein
MKSLHVAGDTFLHRLPAGVKLAGLAVASLVLFLIHSPLTLALAALVAGTLHAMMKLGWRASWQRLRVILLTIMVVAGFTLVINSPADAVAVFFRLVALALLAATITASTSTGEFIDVVTRAAYPLERLGIFRASDIGLAIGLVLRFLPDILGRYQSIRDAHHARGLKPKFLTLAVPLIIQTLKSADEIAAAIDARGIRGQN